MFQSQKSKLSTPTDKLRVIKINKVEKETPTIKSFIFSDEKCSKATPGQFVMAWIPGLDEIPMSLSKIGLNSSSAITVKKLGEASEAFHSLKSGDRIGIRGPYGRGFTPTIGNILIVGGGIGIAPLRPLANNLAKPPSKITFVLGAKRCSELLFYDRIKKQLSKIEARIVSATEDGSHGFKGLATDLADQMLAKQKFDIIYTCGPEKMMQKIFFLAEQYKIPIQASLERIVRCSVGLCGSCMIGKLRVCKDGPVFSAEQLREFKDEFGKFKRDLTSRRIKV